VLVVLTVVPLLVVKVVADTVVVVAMPGQMYWNFGSGIVAEPVTPE
jgi:hypothetical protein